MQRGSGMKKSLQPLTVLGLLLVGVSAAIAQTAGKMVVVADKDVSGEVFKRLGLPSQSYCWQQCLDEQRCTGTRWGTVRGTTAGQCQLMSGVLTFSPLPHLKTEDGTPILVTASRKEPGAR